MSIRNYFNGDLYVDGNFACRAMTIPANSIGNSQVQAGAAGNYIAAEKSEQQERVTYNQAGTAVSETRPIYVCYGATGVMQRFVVGSIAVAIGAATVTVDLRKNGSSVLTGVVTLNSSNTARTVVTATFSNTALVLNDWLEVVVVATAGGGTLPTGLFAQLTVDEDPQ